MCDSFAVRDFFAFRTAGMLALWVTLIALLAALAGCAMDAPRTRLGGLPFPGPVTLFALADPDHLGVTRYEAAPRLFGPDETERGILYTSRAGFLDLAHVRESMDWTRYATLKVAAALGKRETKLDLPGYDDCPFHLTFHYPAYWDDIPAPERRELIADLTLRIGSRVTLEAMTWHEIITWFGFGTTGVWSEKASAFTYEDTMSHVIGVAAAQRALRNPGLSWNRDATRALGDELRDLGIVSKKEAEHAVELVHGKWWADNVCVRRMLDIGLADGAIHPWLVRGMPGGDAPPPAFPLPNFNSVRGRDFSGFWSMTLEPSWLIPAQVRKICNATGSGKPINPDTHFPLLMLKIRHEIKAEFGPTADQPYDD